MKRHLRAFALVGLLCVSASPAVWTGGAGGQQPGLSSDLPTVTLPHLADLRDQLDRHPIGPTEAPIDVLENVLNEFERRQEACILVLDDVHELASTGALACLAYLVDHAPSLLKDRSAPALSSAYAGDSLSASGRRDLSPGIGTDPGADGIRGTRATRSDPHVRASRPDPCRFFRGDDAPVG